MRAWAQRQGATLKRYWGAILAFGGVLGIGAGEVARGGSALWHWAQQQGPWALLALLGLGLWIVHIVHTSITQERERQAQREEREAWQRSLREEREELMRVHREERAALEQRQERMIAILEQRADRAEGTFHDAIAHLVTGQGEQGKQIAGLAAEVRELRDLHARSTPRPQPRLRSLTGEMDDG